MNISSASIAPSSTLLASGLHSGGIYETRSSQKMGVLSITAEPAETTGTDLYELVLLNSTGTRVLLDQNNRKCGLPQICIPRFTRPAEQITSLLRTSWGIKAVLLWSGWIDREPNGERFAVLEAIDNCEHLIPGREWLATDQAVAHLGVRGARLLQQTQMKALKVCEGADPEPFSRLGWIHRLEDWVNGVVRPSGRELLDFSQFNGSETFSLIRFETDSNPLWFKAVGVPNLREFSITLLLSRLFPNYLPTVIASDPLLNGWLMEGGGELTLSDCSQIEIWMKAVRRLAEMLIQSVGLAPQLLQAGCHDLRLETLSSLVSPFFEAMADLMARQVKPSPPPLTIDELGDLAENVQEALSKIVECCDVDTLGHADFNPGNILVDGDESVFTDWAEAYVGSPFPTFEYFLAHLGNSFPSLAKQEDRLREAYITPWLSLISEENLLRALNWSPLIAPYVYAISCNAWRDPKRLSDVRLQGSLRSLTRRMKREADAALQRRKPYRLSVNHHYA